MALMPLDHTCQQVSEECWFWLIMAETTIFLALCFVSALSDATAPPNIIFILADDMGYGDLFGVYPDMNSHFKLEHKHLDAMMASGVAFTDAYAGAPLCSPSRCTLMTGKHTGHCSIRNNGQFLTKADITVASVLKSGGYDTAHFGKWGIGSTLNTNDPISKGFDYYVGQMDTDYCHNYYPSVMNVNQSTYAVPNNQHASKARCGEPDYLDCDWCGDIWLNKTVDYLTHPNRTHKPFFVYLALTTPHAGDVGDEKEYDVPGFHFTLLCVSPCNHVTM